MTKVQSELLEIEPSTVGIRTEGTCKFKIRCLFYKLPGSLAGNPIYFHPVSFLPSLFPTILFPFTPHNPRPKLNCSAEQIRRKTEHIIFPLTKVKPNR